MVQRLSTKFGLNNVITPANIASNLPATLVTDSNISNKLPTGLVSSTTSTPTLTGDGYNLYDIDYTLTVSNSGSYTNPVFFYEVFNSSSLPVDSGIASTSTIIIPKAAFNGGTHTIKVWALEQDKKISSVATKSLGVMQYPAFRYYRVDQVIGAAGATNGGLAEWRLYSGPGQTGTDLVPSSTSASYFYSATYNNTKTRDGSLVTMWWTLGSAAQQWLQYDMGSSVIVRSFKLQSYNAGNYGFDNARIVASNTGSFSGEEVVLYDNVAIGGSVLTLNLG